ncbi:TonB-dependent receptor domain-containing protein [Sphingomonas sp.]|uniref:TonB-dependent receptor domain-containing protein n=1 Tax=Sphingomonas sp. TaxID=28214 RepID=UPI0035BBAF7A
MTSSAARARLLASTLLVGAASLSTSAFAQAAQSTDGASGIRAGGAAATQSNTPGANAQGETGMTTSEAAPNTETSSGDIVVTGSLIKNPALIASAPVQVIGQEEIKLRQSNTAEEILRNLPGAVPSIGSAVNNGNGGASYVDLRGLGSFRNVVLLDGNRIAPSGLVGRVDLNNIPLALVERVDTLTGGAATTYGADAVSGVVNFITRSDFSGVDASISNQLTERGDGNYVRADVTIGANFDDGRGNAVFSIGYQQADPVYQGARDQSFFGLNSLDPNNLALAGSGTAVPATFSGTRPLVGGVPSTTPAFMQTGTTTVMGVVTPVLAPVTGGLANGGNRQLNAAGQAVAAYAPFNFNPYNIFQTPFQRFNMYGAGHYQVSDTVEFYTRGLFSKNTVQTIVAPSGAFTASVTVPLSNPYLPAALRSQICAFNVAPAVNGVTAAGMAASGQIAYTPRFTPAECAAAATAVSPTDPNFRTATVNVSRRTTEVGPRISDFQTTIFDYRAGMKIGITEGLNLDVSGGYGESENTQTLQGYVLTSRLRSAVYATNTTTCLTGAPGGAALGAATGCVPANVFGAEGTLLANQIPYLTGESTTTTRTSLAQARAVLNGDFGFASPFANDSIGFAAGAEYRKYNASQRSDTLAQTAGELGGAGGAAPNVTGGYEVSEGFGELIAPLIQDRAFFQSLTLEAGIRYSHYKVDAPTSPTYNTTTYKAGGSWEPVLGLKVRGNYQRAVRAPNISELFSPVNTGLTNLSTDPCAGANPVGSATLRAVCIAQGAPAGTIGSIDNPTAAQANVTSGGNLNLRPEKSDSYTAGLVIQPQQFLPGFSVTVDYYNIKVKGAVSSFTPGDIITQCFGAAPYTTASVANPACAQIGRSPITGQLSGDPSNTPGLLTAISNLGTIKTDGIDLGINYRRDLGSFAKLALSFAGNWTHDSKFQAAPGLINRECTGYYSVNCASIQPEFYWNTRATLSFTDNIDVSVLWRHIDGVKQEPEDALNGNGPLYSGVVTPLGGGTYNLARIPAYNYIDLSTRFNVADHFDLTFTVQNLFDKSPPFVGATAGATSYNSGNTYPSTYDALGRRYAIGARIHF